MIQDLELFNQDYEFFMEHVYRCTYSDSISRFVNSQLSKYYSANPTMLIDFMSQIERCYPDVDKDFESGMHFGEEDVFSFRLDYEDITYPQIRWLYSYICMLYEGDDLLQKIIAKKEIKKITSKLSSEVSFHCNIDELQLQDLYEALKKEGIVKGAKDSFIKIFTASPWSEISKLDWLIKTNAGAYNKSLFFLLHHLSPQEYENSVATIICEKLAQSFNDLKIGSLKSSYSDWSNQVEAQIVILNKTSRPINKMGELIEIIDQFFPTSK